VACSINYAIDHIFITPLFNHVHVTVHQPLLKKKKKKKAQWAMTDYYYHVMHLIYEDHTELLLSIKLMKNARPITGL
jgi:hypothetical protein